MIGIINDIYFQLLAFGGRVGVWIFVMISGYFLIEQSFKLRKFCKLMAQCFFYSVMIVVFILLFNIQPVNLHEIFKAFLPFGYYSWFAYCYIVFYLFFPFLNILLHQLTQKQFTILLFLGFFLWFVIPTMADMLTLYIEMWKSELILFAYVYGIGAYIRLYYYKYTFSAKRLFIIFAAVLGLYLILGILVYRGSFYYHFLNKNPFFFVWDSTFTIVFSVLLFLIFLSVKMGNKSWVNLAAKTMFGIYLLHDNDLIRYYLWHTVFHVAKLYDSVYMVPKTLLIALSIFCVGFIIDFLRIKILEEPIFSYLNYKIDHS